GTSIGFGVSPFRICGAARSRGSRLGTTERSAFVYGCCGLRTTSLAGPCSTMRPRYITAIRSAKRAAAERSWVIMRMPMSPLQRFHGQLLPLGTRASYPVHEHRLFRRFPDPEPRIERLVGILVDHLQRAPEGAQLPLAQLGDVGAVQPDAAARRLDHAQDSL